MKVILTSRVSKLGQIGDVIEVKNGFAKNFLIPGKKAIAFTPNSQKFFEAKRAEFEQENKSHFEDAEKIKAKIFGKDVVIIESASDDGRLYGSVTSASIAAKANEIAASKTIARSNVFLNKPIKEIGVYSVRLELHSDVVFDVRLIVTRSESEIEALLKADAKAAAKSEESEKKKAKKSEDAEVEQALEAQEVAESDEEKPAKKTRKKKAE